MKSLCLALFLATSSIAMAEPYPENSFVAELPPAPFREILSPELGERFKEMQEVVSSLSHANPRVLAMSQTFLDKLKSAYCEGEGLIEKDVFRILQGVEFAAEKHREQVRKDTEKTPYIIHPIGVAYNLMAIGKVRDPDILIAALLHDTVEDTNTSFIEINRAFGGRVEEFVREVTDDKSLSKVERKQLQIRHASEKSAGAAQIKLGDKLYNLQDLLKSPPSDWPKERVDEYFSWASMVVNNLPWVNAPLKQAVDATIIAYWNR